MSVLRQLGGRRRGGGTNRKWESTFPRIPFHVSVTPSRSKQGKRKPTLTVSSLPRPPSSFPARILETVPENWDALGLGEGFKAGTWETVSVRTVRSRARVMSCIDAGGARCEVGMARERGGEGRGREGRMASCKNWRLNAWDFASLGSCESLQCCSASKELMTSMVWYCIARCRRTTYLNSSLLLPVPSPTHLRTTLSTVSNDQR